MFVHLQPLLTLNLKTLTSYRVNHLCSEIGIKQVSSLQVDNGQVLRGGTEGQNWQFPPRRQFSVEKEEAEMQAWQFRGSCRLPPHLRYPGHQGLSCLLRIVQSCLNGTLLLEVTGCSIVKGEGNQKLCHGSIMYASQWIAKTKWWQAVHSSVYCLTFNALGEPWSAVMALPSVMWSFLAWVIRRASQSIYHLERRNVSLPLSWQTETAALSSSGTTCFGTGVQRLPIML